VRFRELDEIVEAFVHLGVRKIRVTGGEPLLRPGLVNYIHGLKRFPEICDVALTTNGLRLAEMASELKEAGLSRLTVSLDGLSDEIAGKMNGLGVGSKAVLAGIDEALKVGFPIKVNMVVQKGVNDHEILPMAKYFKEREITLRFIEYMDVGNANNWKLEEVVSAKEIHDILTKEFTLNPIDITSSQEVAKRYQYEDGVEIGLISSVSQPFCANCTRARISADGKLFTCLFANKGLDLKSIMRDESYKKEDLIPLLSRHWRKRDDRYSELRSAATKASTQKVEMFYIGG